MVLTEDFKKPKFMMDDVDRYYEDISSRYKTLNTVWERAVSTTYLEDSQDHMVNSIEYREDFYFDTGSTYRGGWDLTGMAGLGDYTLPHNVKYGGQMKDSTFHGQGILKYPRGDVLSGIWSEDKLLSWKYHFADGLKYEEKDWKYCQYPDRRFQRSIGEGLLPACSERKTDDESPREIPEGCYDVGEGFYNPRTKCIVSAVDLQKVIRIPSNDEEKWIMHNCRKAWDAPTGYRPDLYEVWCTGRSGKSRDSLEKSGRGVEEDAVKGISDLIDILLAS